MPRIKKQKSAASCSSQQMSDAIKRKAQDLYEQSGKEPGKDLDNWLEAERIVKKECGTLEQ